MSGPTTGYPYLDAAGGGTIAMAHRGGALHPALVGIENTRAAFAHAVELGYRYLETDVHASADGVLFAFHDDALDRLTDSAGEIGRLTADEIAEARVGGQHPIPRLAELLAAFPDSLFNIDIKSAAAVRPLAALLAATGAEERVCVGAFSLARLRRFRAATRYRVLTSAAPIEVAGFLVLPSAFLRWYSRRRALGALQVPTRRGPLRVAGARLVRRAHRAGVQVHVWTVDEAAEMERLLDLGVDGLITDRTDVLARVLCARGPWAGAGPGAGAAETEAGR